MINGIINVRKEPGYTSHDVVAKLRGICGQKKIGHTGTLDPQAEGVLPICLGSATKVCDLLTDKDKEYVAELLLGIATDTQDTTGQVLSRTTVTEKTFPEETLRYTILGFAGDYDQVPPMYSALKVNGRKLYELAREGRVVERAARRVKIHEIEILEMQLPVIRLRVACSKGTYIRTLCADIGERLGCGGTMQSLVRTRAGSFKLQDAVTLSRLQELKDTGRIEEAVMPVDSVFSACPVLHVREMYRKLLENGNALYPGQTLEGTVYGAGDWVRVYREDQSFAGIYAYDGEKERYRPVKMFPGR